MVTICGHCEGELEWEDGLPRHVDGVEALFCAGIQSDARVYDAFADGVLDAAGDPRVEITKITSVVGEGVCWIVS